MLRFIFACALAVVSLTSQAFVATPSKTLTASKFGVAIDGRYTYWAYYEIDGSDVTYVISHNDLPYPEKKFTLENVVSDHTYPTYVPISGTVQDAIAVDILFSTEETDEDEYEEIWYVIIYDSSNGKCYVYNEYGDMVGELPTNEDGSVGEFMMGAIHEGPTVYYTYSYDEDSNTQQRIIWSFEKGSSVESVEAAPAKIVAYPNPLPSGETLTVDLPNPADSNTIISVIDLSGKQLLRKNVSAGQSEVKMSANLLSTGANIYTVIYSNGESYTGKIIKE